MKNIKMLLACLLLLTSIQVRASIVEPYLVEGPNSSNWAWLTTDQGTQGVSVKLVAFSFGCRPSSGWVAADKFDSAGSADSIFSNGFEDSNVSLVDDTINSSWWFNILGPGAGPNDYQTDRLIALLTQPGHYNFQVLFSCGQGVDTYVRFRFDVP